MWFSRGFEATHAAEQILKEYARFLVDHNESAGAALRYSQLVERFPGNAEYRTLLGNTYLTLGLHDHALQEYQRANDLANGSQGWILANIGNLFNNLGLHGEAITYFNRALEKEPNSEYAHERLAQAQKRSREEVEKVSELLREAQRAVSS